MPFLPLESNGAMDDEANDGVLDREDDAASDDSHTFSDIMVQSLPQRPKRARNATPLHSESSTNSGTESDDDTDSDIIQRPWKSRRLTLSHVEVTGSAYPRSAFDGWQPPLRRSTEAAAIADLQAEFVNTHKLDDNPPDHVSFTLDDFSIYNPRHSRHAQEMVTLDRLQNRGGYNEFLFDGVLSVGNKKHFVQGVQFQIMAVDGYGEADIVSLKDRICIQSPAAYANDVWYCLSRPAQDYERFHRPFAWLAQFTKYFVDYLLKLDNITLHHFRTSFAEWLNSRYGHSTALQDWLDQCNHKTDFRTTIAAHFGYLWKECFSIDDRRTGLCQHPIWGEVNSYALDAIPEQPNRETKTVVTPFVYQCFKRMYFHEHMKVHTTIDSTILRTVSNRKAALGLTPFGACQAPEANVATPQSIAYGDDDVPDVRIGDVVCVEPSTDSAWRHTNSEAWYAYVQNIRDTTKLDVIWLYEPHDTTFGKAFYPFTNELFMSDNCGCGKDAVDLGAVIGKANVTWHAKDPSQQTGLFVRQKFRTIREEDTYDFVTLQESDFHCKCRVRKTAFEECRRQYQIGDTVLVREWNTERREDALEPSQIVDFDLDRARVVLRRLKRKSKVDKHAAPNEPTLSDEQFTKMPSRVVRRCRVRLFSTDEFKHGLPTSYDRRGAGDYFFILCSEDDGVINTREASDQGDAPDTGVGLRDGDFAGNDRPCFPPVEPDLNEDMSDSRKLKGMGIFCGGGNFDRGLEDGGGVKFRYAIDWATRAIHSYRANVDNPQDVQFFLGSVNDYLAQAMAGSSLEVIAKIGNVDFISAGSPCPGFSNLQVNKQSNQSLRNASLVASVVSYVDLYSPKYCILENVVSMTAGMGVRKDENVFAQVVAALVGLGYQVQQFLMDAWNYASSESRSRVFIIASAPGLAPWVHPHHTHAHPPEVQDRRSLGKSSNGLRFGLRRFDYTPFAHVSPLEATSDIPDVEDSQPQICPAFPDHITPSEEGPESRARIAAVPVWPLGQGLAQAAQAGRLFGSPLEWYERQGGERKGPGSRTYSRVNRDGLFRTVTTALNLQCGRSGSTLHWQQPRSLTVMELRRALGYPDDEVIIGTPREKVKTIGNSVDRNVALALGLSLTDSWIKSNPNREAALTSTPSMELEMVLIPGPDSARNADGGRALHRSALSQEERLEVLDDPKHGFSIINRILTDRRNSVPSSAGADDTADSEL